VTITVRNEDGTVSFEVVANADADIEASPIRDRVEALGGRLSIPTGSGDEMLVAGSLPVSG
jgi:hypothetical protein